MKQWGQAGIGSATIRLKKNHDWPLFVAAVIITAHEADNPNARYLDTLLTALCQLDEHVDADDPNKHDQQSNLERLWNSIRTA